MATPVHRGGPANSGGTPGPSCDGVFALDVNQFAAGLYAPPFPANHPAPFLLQAGTAVSMQWWGRDSPATGSFMSSAVAYQVCP
jgi:hypothetical protein